MQQELPGRNIRKLLRDELKSRCDRNPRYSLRSLAHFLDISPSGLSSVMGGKIPVTIKFVEKIGKKLNLPEKKVQQYQIELLSEKHNTDYNPKNFEFIDADRFAIIKDWYHYAILNLMRTKEFKPQANWIARRLGISLGEVQTAVERLQQAQLLKIEGDQWTDLSSQFTSHTNNKAFSEAARLNQKQLFEKALKAVEEVEFNERNHTGCSVAVAIKDLDEAKEFITQFRREFMNRFDRSAEADEVYHLSVGLFPLSKKIAERGRP